MVTGNQVAAARALLQWSQADLAEKSNLSVPTIKRMEGAHAKPIPGQTNNALAVMRALEDGGIQFIAPNGGGPGVRLRRK